GETDTLGLLHLERLVDELVLGGLLAAAVLDLHQRQALLDLYVGNGSAVDRDADRGGEGRNGARHEECHADKGGAHYAMHSVSACSGKPVLAFVVEDCG